MTLKGQTRDPSTLRAQYLENYVSYRLQNWCAALYRECRAGTQIIFPENGRGLGHMTLQFLGYDRTYLQKPLELDTSNLVHGFVWVMQSRRTNNFPESERGLGLCFEVVSGHLISLRPAHPLSSSRSRSLF